jgi:hypothetical protein
VLLQLGRLGATPGSIRTLTNAATNSVEFIARHLAGDWGELDAEDTGANHRALQLGERIISAYRTNGEKGLGHHRSRSKRYADPRPRNTRTQSA